MENIYKLSDEDGIISPSLIYYRDIIVENIRKAIETAGSAERLWPHVKSHKSADMVRLQMSFGITRFKTATIAEAEMAASCGAPHVLLAYPLVGPNIARFVELQKAFVNTCFWAVGEDYGCIARLGELSASAGISTRLMLDVNMGMDRTGIAISDSAELYKRCAGLSGMVPCGFHCYDGNRHESDPEERKRRVAETAEKLKKLREDVVADGFAEPVFVMGGTPSFPCHAGYPGVFLSPGTLFLSDAGYSRAFKDMNFTPAAVLLTRVVSHPAPGKFTLDLGAKGIASDPPGQRGFIVGHEEDYKPLFQNEEHWVFEVPDGEPVPGIGKVFYVVPTHICPTSALYPSVPVAEGGRIVGEWEITARNRKITY